MLPRLHTLAQDLANVLQWETIIQQEQAQQATLCTN
jgi:hypothetical protein